MAKHSSTQITSYATPPLFYSCFHLSAITNRFCKMHSINVRYSNVSHILNPITKQNNGVYIYSMDMPFTRREIQGCVWGRRQEREKARTVSTTAIAFAADSVPSVCVYSLAALPSSLASETGAILCSLHWRRSATTASQAPPFVLRVPLANIRYHFTNLDGE